MLLFVLAAACSQPPSLGAQVSLEEFSIVSSANRLSAGLVELGVLNTGRFGHTLVISNQEGTVLSATELIPSGDQYDLTVQLPAGRYLFTCRIVTEIDSGAIIDHYQEGMVTTVDVIEPIG